MRLPTATHRQAQLEDARQFSERLYTAFLRGVPIGLPITKLNWREVQLETSCNQRQFWHSRGFWIRTRTDKEKTTLTVWLEQGQSPRRKTGVGETMRGVRTVGPVVPVICAECGWQGDRKRAWGDFSLGECRQCGGDLKVRPRTNDTRADAKAKRELAEQEGAA